MSTIVVGADPRVSLEPEEELCPACGGLCYAIQAEPVSLSAPEACPECAGTGRRVKPPAGPQKRPRGFAAMPPEARRALGQRGGLKAQAGAGHQLSAEERARGGRAGGALAKELHLGHRFDSETGRTAALKARRIPP